ncbi:flagellar biosynthetic protein FliO [Methylobacterium sp.]|uniref:flagellar biosynthetic protein FliO n=1 Tax=Methylobacterium sp. TaxID=409 RepID=UPI002635A171|nr:flagellar biosynthetic protein FliO [Methylobacterium sp.]MDB5648400.1 hypothetical protein [Methylobacterium sp.]
MSSLFSSDGSFSLQFAIIFVVIFLVLAGGVFLLRRFTGQGRGLSNKTPPRGRQPRLGIVDIYELDRQRQLILLRRDNVEHLLLVGGPNDVVVERNITRGINARLPTDETAYDEPPEPAPAANPVPQVPVQYPPEPIPQYSGPALAPAAAYFEPSFTAPASPQVPVVASEPAAPVDAPPLDLPPRDEIRPPQQSEARPAKESPFARVIRRAPPSLVNLVPAALTDRGRAPEPSATPLVDAPLPASVVSAPATRAIDAAILSDMARQLEEALRRPSAAVRPAVPVQAEPQAPEPGPSAAEPEIGPTAPTGEPQAAPLDDVSAPASDETHPVDPVAAAMAAATQEPVPAPTAEAVGTDEALFVDEADLRPAKALRDAEPVPTEPVFVEAFTPEPVVRSAVADVPQVDLPPAVESEPPPFLAPQPAAPEPVPTPKPAPKPAAAPNPFSVEEIEAEFARLLGRPLDRKS